MSKLFARSAFAVALILFAGFSALLLFDHARAQRNQDDPRPPLVVQCGTGMRPALDEIVRAYEKETGQHVEVRYGGSQTVLTNLQVTGQGDLFLPGDESYIDIAQKKDLLAEILPLARMRAVILVRDGFPSTITSADLLADGVRLAQCNPDAAAIGKLTRATLTASGQWETWKKCTTDRGHFTPNVADVASAVQLGTVDAGIVWDVTAFQHPKLKAIRIPELDAAVARVQLAVVKKSTQPTEALRFARFVAARDRGLEIFRKKGFTEVEKGDKYARAPELILFGGSMLRPAITETLNEFKEREGIDIVTTFNGCGNLVSTMKAGSWPDVYFACDPQFMTMVQHAFEEPAIISSNQLVIAVPRGNPHDLLTLKDLGKPNLRVGVGHEQQCALGALTKESFVRTGTYASVMKNVVVQSATGDFLVNQLRTGSLDAVVAYQSNTMPYDDLESISVTGIPCASPLQPVAVSRTTDYPQLTHRLLRALQSPVSRERFRKLGFGWEWRKN